MAGAVTLVDVPVPPMFAVLLAATPTVLVPVGVPVQSAVVNSSTVNRCPAVFAESVVGMTAILTLPSVNVFSAADAALGQAPAAILAS